MKSVFRTLIATAMLAGVFAAPVSAGVVVYEEGDKKIEVGGRIQVQYRAHRRRCPVPGDRPVVLSAGCAPTWPGHGDRELVRQDPVRLRQGRGFQDEIESQGCLYAVPRLGEPQDHHRQLQDAVLEGVPCLLEAPAVGRTELCAGDHNFRLPRPPARRSPRRPRNGQEDHLLRPQLGYEKNTTPRSTAWTSTHPVEQPRPTGTRGSWWRRVVDYHPLGFMKFDQADFRSDDWKVNFSVAAFNWSNDDDNNTYTDSVTGMVNATKAWRTARSTSTAPMAWNSAPVCAGRDFSADVRVPEGQRGYRGSDLHRGSVPRRNDRPGHHRASRPATWSASNVELVAGWDTLDADNFTAEHRPDVLRPELVLEQAQGQAANDLSRLVERQRG